jgi:hypothetical protein
VESGGDGFYQARQSRGDAGEESGTYQHAPCRGRTRARQELPSPEDRVEWTSLRGSAFRS